MTKKEIGTQYMKQLNYNLPFLHFVLAVYICILLLPFNIQLLKLISISLLSSFVLMKLVYITKALKVIAVMMIEHDIEIDEKK